jgi:Protein of unknown function (DUF1517)
MTGWRDRLNRMGGRTRFAVCRIFVHLAGDEAAPILGVLNQAAREAVDAEGDIQMLGEGLVEICQALLQTDLYWQSAANEGDVFWDEGEAGDYVSELFTDSAQRYGVAMPEQLSEDDLLTIPVTPNLLVILTVAYEGESPALETDLANLSALRAGLNALINLHYDNRLRAIQIHFAPAQFGDVLTSEQLLLNFPELIPL